MNNEIVSALLGSKNPSVRYDALTGLAGRSDNDPDVLSAKSAIMSEGLVPVILGKQKPGGYWGKPEDFYMRSKYKGTVWNMTLLAELGADPADERIRAMCEFILTASYAPSSGGFTYSGHPDGVIPCLTGNMAWSLIRFGYADDPRVRKSLEWMAEYQRYDDGDGKPGDEPFYRFEKCWGKHTCHHGVVKMLKAFAEIPAGARTGKMTAAVEKGIEYILIHRIYKSSRDPSRAVMKRWMELGFPHMWNSDIIEVLSILAKLGVKDARTGDAVEFVLSKRPPDGWWINEHNHHGCLATAIEKQGAPSEWVTLNALKVLDYYRR
ncbi:MAG: nitrogen fixation protein NifH [Brevinematales bacterium]|nr:nitrogen fixation protein NifH [Brevinematales bacterium]